MAKRRNKRRPTPKARFIGPREPAQRRARRAVAAFVERRPGAGKLLSLARRHLGAAAGGIAGMLTDTAVAQTDTLSDDKASGLLKMGAAVGLDYLGGDWRNVSMGVTGQTAAREVSDRLLPADVREKAQRAREALIADRKAARVNGASK